MEVKANIMGRLFTLMVVASVLFFFASGSALAGVTLSDQGTDVRLKSTGALLETGNITISIHTAITGGTQLYSYEFEDAIKNGSWNIMLGQSPGPDLNLSFGTIYYKDYTINGEDVDFLDGNGATVERQIFESPLGPIDDVNITGSRSDDWDDAYSWGDHALAGYLSNNTNAAFTSITSDDWSNITITSSQISDLASSINDTNCSVDGSCSNIVYNSEVSNWDQNVSDDFNGSWTALTDIPAGFADGVDGGTLYTNTLTVDSGGLSDFTTIQSAIDNITDATEFNPYTIRVMPGTYNEQITMKDWVSIMGISGFADEVTINSSTAPVIDWTSTNDNSITGVRILHHTSSDQSNCALKISGAGKTLSRAVIDVEATNAKACAVNITGTIPFIMKDVALYYDQFGETPGQAEQNIIEVNGPSVYFLVDIIADISIYDPDDNISYFRSNGPTYGTIATNNMDMEIVNTSFSGLVRWYCDYGTNLLGEEKILTTNIVEIDGPGVAGFGSSATAMCLFFSSSNIASNNNHYHITGIDTSYDTAVSDTATMYSHFDEFISRNGTFLGSNISNYEYVSSEDPGSLWATQGISIGKDENSAKDLITMRTGQAVEPVFRYDPNWNGYSSLIWDYEGAESTFGIEGTDDTSQFLITTTMDEDFDAGQIITLLSNNGTATESWTFGRFGGDDGEFEFRPNSSTVFAPLRLRYDDPALALKEGVYVKSINASIGSGSSDTELATALAIKTYVDAQVGNASVNVSDVWVNTTGDTMTGNLTFQGASISQVQSIQFNTSYVPPHQEGLLHWNSVDGTLEVGSDISDVVLQIGQESYARVINNESTTILNGQPVYVTSGSNGFINVMLAHGNDSIKSRAIGLVTADIAAGAEGFVTTFGLVRDINTSSFSAGDRIYVCPDQAGCLTNFKPSYPNYATVIGYVAEVGETNGTIFVSPFTEITTIENLGVSGKLLVGSGQNLRLDLARYAVHTGLKTGGVVTINPSNANLVDISAGTAVYADYSNLSDIIVEEISWPNQTFDPQLTGQRSKWIGIQRNGTEQGEPVAQTSFGASDIRTIVEIARVWGNGSAEVTNVGKYSTPAFNSEKTLEDLMDMLGSLNKEGNVFSANSGGNLLVDRSAGTAFRFASNYGSDPTSPNVRVTTEQTGITTYQYHLQNKTFTLAESQIDPDNYDVNGVKTAVPSGNWTVQRLYYFPGSNNTHVVYGQALYDNIEDAEAGINTEGKVLNADILEGSVLRAWLLVKQGTTDLTNTSNAKFVTVSSTTGVSAAASTETDPFFINWGYDWDDMTNLPAGFDDDVDNDTTYSNLSEFTNDIGYLTSYTETDPIFSAENASIYNAINNRAAIGDCTAGEVVQNVTTSGVECVEISFTDTNETTRVDALYVNATNWNTAFGWGDHAVEGYLLAANLTPYLLITDFTWGNLSGIPAGFADDVDNDTQLTETQVDNFVANNGYLTLSNTTGWDTNASDDFVSDQTLNTTSNVQFNNITLPNEQCLKIGSALFCGNSTHGWLE